MSRYLLAIGVVLAVVTALPATAAAKKPPSVAHWLAGEATHQNSLLNPINKGCGDAFFDDDLKRGECFVTGVLKVFPVIHTRWQHGLATIAKGQTDACKRAIHTYVLARQKNYVASMAYLRAHTATPYSTISSDVTSGIYKTLTANNNATKANAIRVCG